MKNSFKNALYNAFGYIFPVAVALFTTPYIVKKLTPEIYGIYVLAISLMGLMSFMDLGFGQGIIKFVSQYEAKKDYKKINQILSVSLFINSVMGILGGLLIFISADFLVKLFKVNVAYHNNALMSFKIVSLGFFITLLNSVFSNVPKALQRYDIAVKIQNILWLSSVLFIIILLYLGKGLIEILTFYLFFQLIGLIIYALVAKKLLPQIKLKPSFDKKVFKEIFSFSIYTAINSITGNIVFRVDKMIISAFLGTEAVTYYQIPFMVVQMANGFVSSVLQFLFPAVSYVNSAGEKDKLRDIYEKSLRYVTAFSLIIFAGLIFIGDTFISLWIGREFAEKSVSILPIIALVFFFQSFSVVGFYFYNGLGKAKINMISSFIGSLSYIIAALFLITQFKLIGAGLSFAFTLVPFPGYFYILNNLIGGDIRWLLGALVKSILILAVIIVFKYLISIPGHIGWSIFAGLLMIGFVIILSYLLKIIYSKDFLELMVKLSFKK